MSFLNQLKSQAKALQTQQGQTQLHLEENTNQTETACRIAWPHLEDLARHLNVISPAAPRFSVVHPEKNTLQAIQFEYLTETRGNVYVTPDHDKADLAFRLLNVSGFGIVNTTWPAGRIRTEVLDELAKLIVSEPNRFV